MIGVKIAKLAEDVPCVVVFRALAMSNIADREVLEYICNDFRDHEMMERFRPSLEEAAIIQSQDRALVFIANRAGPVTEGAAEAALKKYATDLLSRDFLPHMGVRSDSGTREYFLTLHSLHPPNNTQSQTNNRHPNEKTILFGIHDSSTTSSLPGT